MNGEALPQSGNRVVIRDQYGAILLDRDMPTVPVIGDTISGIELKTFLSGKGHVVSRDYNIHDSEWELKVVP